MTTLREVLKKNNVAKFLVNTVRFLKAVRVYNATGVTPEYGYNSARYLYFATNKLSHKLFAAAQNFADRKNRVTISNPVGILGDMSTANLKNFMQNLREDGFHRFGQLLPPDMCDDLLHFALTTPAKPRIARFEGKIVYDRNNLVANLYDFDAQSLLENRSVQRIITDESLLSVAHEFLGPSVRLQNVSMWWSNADFHNVSKDTAAQMYHVDMDTIRWLNFFFYLVDVDTHNGYLVDVDTHNGPHVYIRRSHRQAPKSVYRDYRIPDEEIAQVFAPEDIVELTGPRGTILAVDTLGLHKGKALERGERLMLTVRFAVNNFGAGAPSKVQINEKFSPEFLAKIDQNPSVYRRGYF
ncbi:MAG: hypothetical protein RML40_11955 [Bacteroidota bacterium]|nr:phytanoyl-CoA dioxygenase family protein [Candidatus Kapabacteria bacterium]MDW8221229.1 hypothetical protein [Bacteroidota bacterium]